ncbi:spermidine synthase [Novosphingobium tardum]|uniref:Spermidine synthase n=1 Tax=Novosphingobium tardum TaxID=1538021 RepID=A0ABV8RL12_9SPHN
MSAAGSERASTAQRGLFVATVLAGSFLLFLVQPMVARLALPRLGGAPAVWNSAMLVYQALLLGGYAYAHWLSRWPVARQAMIQLGLLLVATFTLPVHLAAMAPPGAGQEAWWVPLLLASSIGPVFFLVSAQAPLMQRWFSASRAASDPYPLYAASNLGSFAGLIAYPLLVEPLLPLRIQVWGWSVGYAVLIALIVLAARARWHDRPLIEANAGPSPSIPRRRIAMWLALAAVPSGLMLSTTTHLTTDLFAMPLLWVIPLGLYLLSFVPAFSERRGVSAFVTSIAPVALIGAGGLALVSRNNSSLLVAVASLVLLFVVAVALHSRLYELRPPPERLTLFYLVMSAGGALGGLFAALLAPVLFDWVWEHPMLVLTAALLLPLRPLLRWRESPGIGTDTARIVTIVIVMLGAGLAWVLFKGWFGAPALIKLALSAGILFCGIMVADRRWALMTVLALLMLAQGGIDTIQTSLAGSRTRSYFGVYTVLDYPELRKRLLSHGTTLHGMQFTDARRLQPTTYYGPTSGVGRVLSRAPEWFGERAQIGIVGLGTGTLACWRRPGQRWTIFEIDPAVLALSTARKFTFLSDCASDAAVRLGDARLMLTREPAASFDVLAIDAFSSDAIPLHLLTAEAIGIYERALQKEGILLLHISNRYFELEPQLSAGFAERGLTARVLTDNTTDPALAPSVWVAVARQPATIANLAGTDARWEALVRDPSTRAWSDDHASILPAVRWRNIWGSLF